jgi:hypothetical protein
MDRHWLALSIGTRCSLENHFIDDFFAVERMLGGCCGPDLTGQYRLRSKRTSLYVYGYLNRVQSSRRLEREQVRSSSCVGLIFAELHIP